MTLTTLSITFRHFVKKFLYWELSGVSVCLGFFFSLLLNCTMCFWKEDHRSKAQFSPRHVIGSHYEQDSALLMLTFIILLKLSGFSTVKLLFFITFPHCTPCKDMCSPHLNGSIAPHPWDWNIDINYLEFFHVEYLSLLFHLFIR